VRVRWLRAALANLDAEAEYIAVDNPAAAGRVVQKILRAVDLLKQNPALGRAGRVAGTRELVVAETPYIIPYRVRGDAVEILRVFHAARSTWGTGLSVILKNML
jgi:toxin ParE1/3/4